MIYRGFRHTASGRWLSTLVTSGGGWTTVAGEEYEPEFRVSPEQHRLDVLAAYASQGWAENDLEVVDSYTDPREGSMIDPDPADVDPDAERLESLHALLAAQDLTGPQTSEMLRLERKF